MRELQFIAQREGEWALWDRWLAGRRPRPAQGGEDALPPAELPARFRRLCRDLSLARDRQYSAMLQDSLHRRVLAVHQRVYGARRRDGNAFLGFLLQGFPALVRREWRVTLAGALLLFLPMLLMIGVLQHHPDGIYLVLPAEQVAEMQDMYAPDARHLGRPRSASSQWMMWGLYIANNVRIDFQCFAGGIAFGLGSVFFLLFNGMVLGAVAGHLTQIGYVETFWGFVAGHSAFELTGAALSGAAGLKIGIALIAPGRRSRLAALKENGRVAVQLLAGAAALTFCAAFIEAFWSPTRSVPVELKYGVGVALWLLTLAYLLFAGRARHAP